MFIFHQNRIIDCFVCLRKFVDSSLCFPVILSLLDTQTEALKYKAPGFHWPSCGQNKKNP